MKNSLFLDLDDTKVQIIHHQFRNIFVKTFLIFFDKQRRILSTLEGFRKIKFIGNHYNPPELWDYIHKNKKEYEKEIYNDLNINPDEIAMLFTGVDIDNTFLQVKQYENIKICACVTAGIKSNAQRIGVDEAGIIEREESYGPGTVNIILLTNASLTDGAMARSIITITEAKTIAFQDLDIRSSYDFKIQATGTGTDNIIIVSGFGSKINYTGGHTKAGELIAKAVTTAVMEAIVKEKKVLKNN